MTFLVILGFVWSKDISFSPPKDLLLLLVPCLDLSQPHEASLCAQVHCAGAVQRGSMKWHVGVECQESAHRWRQNSLLSACWPHHGGCESKQWSGSHWHGLRICCEHQHGGKLPNLASASHELTTAEVPFASSQLVMQHSFLLDYFSCLLSSSILTYDVNVLTSASSEHSSSKYSFFSIWWVVRRACSTRALLFEMRRLLHHLK